MYTKWVEIWGNAMSIATRKPENYAKNLTLRYPIYSPFKGNKIRLTFDNICGNEAITIDKITIALEDKSPTLDSEGNKIKAFGGKIQKDTLIKVDGFTIEAGKKHTTEPVDFNVSDTERLVISFYLKDFTEMRSAVVTEGPLSEAYFSIGDQSEYPVLDAETTKLTHWNYFLSDVEVFTEEKNHAIICYGDSITAEDWPEYLTLILKEKGIKDTAIIRKAASGTRILREYSSITYDSYGLKGEHRVPREWHVSGADIVIIQQGINDIIHPVGYAVNQFRPMSDLPTIEEMMEGIDRYIDIGKDMGFKVYLGALLPIYGWRTYEDFREVMKNEFNECLAKDTKADGFIDFHKATENPKKPKEFNVGLDSGDHLHPSAAGYKAMAMEAYKVLFEK